MMLSYQKWLLLSSATHYFQNVKAELCVPVYIFTRHIITSVVILNKFSYHFRCSNIYNTVYLPLLSLSYTRNVYGLTLYYVSMWTEQCANDDLILGGSYSTITMIYNTILPKYQTIEIKKTSKTSKKSFDSILMSGIVFPNSKNSNLDTKID